MTTTKPVVYRRRRAVEVHPHRSGLWRFTCGRRLNKVGTHLVPQDFYFSVDKEAALRAARKKAAEWDFIQRNWHEMYAVTLSLIDSPFAHVPHWHPVLGNQVSDAAVAAHHDRPITDLDYADAYEGVTLVSLIGLYNFENEGRVRRGEITQSTYDNTRKRLKNAQRFFPAHRPLNQIDHFEWLRAKEQLVAAIPTRRAAKNYLDALKMLLTWFYDRSPYGAGHDRPTAFSEIFSLAKVRSRPISVYSAADLKRLLTPADDKIRLLVYLALNLGAYQADIASLNGDEMSLAEGHVLWDRTKEPENHFLVMHKLWPETQHLAAKFWSGSGFGWDAKSIANSFERYCRREGLKFQFRNLRKTTNQIIADLIGSGAGENHVAACEICTEFLGQRTRALMERYRIVGAKTYGRMNRYLTRAGDVLREQGVLW